MIAVSDAPMRLWCLWSNISLGPRPALDFRFPAKPKTKVGNLCRHNSCV